MSSDKVVLGTETGRITKGTSHRAALLDKVSGELTAHNLPFASFDPANPTQLTDFCIRYVWHNIDDVLEALGAYEEEE